MWPATSRGVSRAGTAARARARCRPPRCAGRRSPVEPAWPRAWPVWCATGRGLASEARRRPDKDRRAPRGPPPRGSDMTSAVTPQLSDAELAELLQLIRGADSVELKLTVPESSQRSAIASLAMQPLGAQIRQGFFFGPPELPPHPPARVGRAPR